MSAKLVLMRHGQSEWNRHNLFTGWVDIPLSREGIEESLRAGDRIDAIPFDLVFVSALIRTQMTALLAMSRNRADRVPVVLRPNASEGKVEEDDLHLAFSVPCIPVIVARELNERMYGALQGRDKKRVEEEVGSKRVRSWRRGYSASPPGGESLEETAHRCLPYFYRSVVPHLSAGKHVLIVAHGNSLRSLIMGLEKSADKEELLLDIPTAGLFCYSYEGGDFFREDVDSVQNAFQRA